MDHVDEGCIGKVRHRRRGDAIKAIRNMQTNHRGKSHRSAFRGLPQEYHCHTCGGWHIGGQKR